ncbi:MAG TPA: pyrroloquinoline quinone-dependent dehydrogenase [Vicinamibacteria bacterium]|nr:pyrroloquinoline quinone-dependent dehydrogenase [Vicinamibacteria bacterium]
MEALTARWPRRLVCAAAAALAVGSVTAGRPAIDGDWRFYGGDSGGSRFSTIADVDRDNVKSLRRAWTYHTGDLDRRPGAQPTAFEATPLAVDGVLYLSTPSGRAVALDGDSGQARWTFSPPPREGRSTPARGPHRGVSYWESADGRDRRILFGTPDGRLIALDAASGQPRLDFGRDGMVDLRHGLTEAWPHAPLGVSSPPAIHRDLVIVGSHLQEYPPRGPAGDVRAYDVRTGALVWRFHTVPRPGEAGHDSWDAESGKDRSGANVWSVMSVDTERGLVFLPVGSAAYDFYGGDRPGANLFANSLVALDAATGARRWHFQTVHHDLWDYDLPAQPALVTVRRDGREVAAVAQVTKTGFVFVLDRETGRPLFPVDERPVPPSSVPGEKASPTQPVPRRPPPLVRQSITRDDLTAVTPESQRQCRELFDSAQTGPLFTPPGLTLTLTFPGTLGGANWSGAAFDPTRRGLYVNVNEVGALGGLQRLGPGAPIPYRRAGSAGEYARFWDDNRWPCQKPPWGTLNAVDLDEGVVAWTVPLGVVDALVARGVPPTGTPSLGGAIATAGGLIFIAGTGDARFRAFEADTGRELWADRLEASGHATPMTYRGRSGRQYVVIAAGGGGYLSRTTSDVVAAYALSAP